MGFVWVGYLMCSDFLMMMSMCLSTHRHRLPFLCKILKYLTLTENVNNKHHMLHGCKSIIY